MTRRALGKGLEAIFANLGSEVMNPQTGASVHEVELVLISANPFQPRHEFVEEELQELALSISEKGLIQPIMLRKYGEGYQIVAGERRFRAFQRLEKTHIPALVREQISDRDMMELALVENVQRVQLNPIEEAQAYEQLINACGMTHEEIAGRVSKSRVAVTNTLRLLKLEPPVLQWLREGKLTAGHGRALLQSHGEEQVKRARLILDTSLNVRQAERKAGSPVPKPLDPNTRAFLEELRSLLGMKVSLRGGARKGVLEIHYMNRDDIENLMRVLRRQDSLRVAVGASFKPAPTKNFFRRDTVPPRDLRIMSKKKRFVTLQILPDDLSEAWTLRLRYRFFEFLFYAAVVALFAVGFAAVKIVQIQGKVLLANHLAARNQELMEQQKKMELLERELAAVTEKERAVRDILQAFLGGAPADSTNAAPAPAWASDLDSYLEGVRTVERRLESKDANLLREKQPSIWPVKGIVSQRFSAGGPEGRHDGIDILAEENTLVMSAAKGVVTESGWDPDLGRYVRINHDFGVETVYGHLARSFVRPGDQVGKGSALGLVGNTGRSLGPHLHFEIIFKGKPVDPMPYLQ